MNIAYLDCTVGVAGDMLLGALIDAGASIDEIKSGLETMHKIKGEWDIKITKVVKGPGQISGTKVHVTSIYDHEQLPPPSIPAVTNHTSSNVEIYAQNSDHSYHHVHTDAHSHHHGNTHEHSHNHDHDHSDAHDQLYGSSEEMQHNKLNNHSHPHHLHTHHHQQPVRNLSDITEIIKDSSLSPWVQSMSIRVFTLLAEAEAHTHGTTIDMIHFHEVGAIDSLIDTIGCVLALDLLGAHEIYSSPLPFSSGVVKCMHGILPVPPPATFRLMINVPVIPAPKSATGELVTPTGISLVKALTIAYGEPPPFLPSHTGVGAGTKEFQSHANIVRVMVGRKIDNTNHSMSAIAQEQGLATQQVIVLETNIDDANPQVIGYTQELALSNNALDVWIQPIQMKKNRPGVLLSVMCLPIHEANLVQLLLKETTTLGIRRKQMDRYILQRKFIEVNLYNTQIPVKVGYESNSNQIINIHPEFEICKVIAQNTKLPLLQIINEAQHLASQVIKNCSANTI